MSETINFEEADIRKAVGGIYFFGALTGAGMVLLVAMLLLGLDETIGLLQPLIGQSTGGSDTTLSLVELFLLIAGLLLTGRGLLQMAAVSEAAARVFQPAGDEQSATAEKRARLCVR